MKKGSVRRCDVKTLCPVCDKEFHEGDEKPNNELRELICGVYHKIIQLYKLTLLV